MKKTGIIISLIGLLFTVFATVGLLVKEGITNPGLIEAAQIKIHHRIWEPMVGAIVIIIGISVYKASKKNSANLA